MIQHNGSQYTPGDQRGGRYIEDGIINRHAFGRPESLSKTAGQKGDEVELILWLNRALPSIASAWQSVLALPHTFFLFRA